MTHMPHVSARLLALLALIGLTLLPAHSAWATMYTVNDTSDSATDGTNTTGSLRFAVSQAHSGDTINITTTGTVVETSPLVISKSVTINGPAPGSGTFALSGNLSGFNVVSVTAPGLVNLSYITLEDALSNTAGGGLVVASGSSVGLNGCTITGNGAPSGGGIENHGTLTLFTTTVSGNDATGGGGGIDNAGSLTMTYSSLSSNGNSSQTTLGGGLDNESGATAIAIESLFSQNNAATGGGIENAGSLTLQDGVFLGNAAAQNGGGMDTQSSSGTTQIVNCSFSANTAATGTGDGLSCESGTADLLNDILDDASSNGGASDAAASGGGTIATAFCDLAQPDSGVTADSHSISQDPDFINPTSDLHLRSASPCLGAGAASATLSGASVSAPTVDFDGFTRPAAPAIGAYDVPQSSVSVTFNGDTLLASGSLGADSPDATILRAAIDYANDYPGVSVGFDPNVFSFAQTIGLTSGTLTVNAPMTITGPSVGVTLNAELSGPVFIIHNTNGQVALSGLTITGGGPVNTINGVQGGGGVVVSSGANAALTDCVLTNNGTEGNGGGVSNLGTVTLTGCTLTGNSASGTQGIDGGEGGGLYNDGTATVTGCYFGLSIVGGSVTGSANQAALGGGIDNDTGGTLTLSDSVLAGNFGLDGGGGVNNVATNVTLVVNCVFAGNSAGNSSTQAAGGGVLDGSAGSQTTPATAATIAFVNCTFTGNTATNGGGAIYSYGGVTLVNDILYGDTDTSGMFPEDGNQLEGDSSAYNCDIQGFNMDGQVGLNAATGTASANTANISGNPDFDTPYTSSTAVYDLRLGTGSPAIGAGAASADGLTAPTTDITGANRPTPPSMGAFDINATEGTGPPAVSSGTTAPTQTSVSVTTDQSSYTTAQSITVTANVSPTSAAGTVTFTLNLTPSQPVTVTNGVATTTFPAGTLGPGVYNAFATFTPTNSSAFTGSTNSSTSFSVSNASGTPTATTTAAPTASPAAPTAGQSLTLSATVTPSTAAGSVTFTVTPSGAGAATTATGTVTSGTATATLASGLSAGSYTVTAAFTPTRTTAFSASTSTAATLTVSSAGATTVLTTFQPGLQLVCLDETYTSFATALNNTGTPPAYDTYNGSGYTLVNSASEAAPAPGTGFWIAPGSAVSIFNTGTLASGTVTIHLAQGWHLIGDPFSAPVSLTTGVSVNGTTGLAAAYTQDLLSPTLYTWGTSNTASYTSMDGAASGASLQPFTGYWLYAFQSGVTLTLTATD